MSWNTPGVVYNAPGDGQNPNPYQPTTNVQLMQPSAIGAAEEPPSLLHADSCEIFGKYVKLKTSWNMRRISSLSEGFKRTMGFYGVFLLFAMVCTILIGYMTLMYGPNFLQSSSDNSTSTDSLPEGTSTGTTEKPPKEEEPEPVVAVVIVFIIITVIGHIIGFIGFIGIYTLRKELIILSLLIIIPTPIIGTYFGLDRLIIIPNILCIPFCIAFVCYLQFICEIFREGRQNVPTSNQQQF